MVPRLWGTKLYSTRLADAHFWIGTFGILLYITAMWISGISQGLYWGALNPEGFLKYPDFVEGLNAQRFMYMMRLAGGTAYLFGFVLCAVNVFATIAAGKKVDGRVTVPAKAPADPISGWKVLRGAPAVLSTLIVLAAAWLGIASPNMSVIVIGVAALLVVGAILLSVIYRAEGKSWHGLLEGKPLVFTFLVLLAILAGGVAELIPTIVLRPEIPVMTAEAAPGSDETAAVESPGETGAAGAAAEVEGDHGDHATIELRSTVTGPVNKTAGNTGPAGFSASWDPERVQQPYSPLELAGRDIYVSEGCYVCHSQMIRPFRHETLRYGDYSRAEEFIYDRPFLWGSKRTGPDLHRVGGKYPNLWHYQHMRDPRSTSPGSLMPNYDFLKVATVDLGGLGGKISAMKTLGVPYTDQQILTADSVARSQARLIVDDLAQNGVEITEDSQLVALIAYLQRLGRGPQPTGDVQTAEVR
jgi:cytochrome c oxidase cbb3-type subunit I/II